MVLHRDVVWRDHIADDKYTAAQSYLLLIRNEPDVAVLLAKLQAAELTQFRAKDIFRAAQLPLLDNTNARVKRNRQKIEKGASFSPLLLVRDVPNSKVILADGYHRLCAIYAANEETWIRCKIV